uniref:Uncharacterized protein n=1 Tax=Romanomermis culicivorax TaxID=13658 RepID=A0A915K4C2_ROMCU
MIGPASAWKKFKGGRYDMVPPHTIRQYQSVVPLVTTCAVIVVLGLYFPGVKERQRGRDFRHKINEYAHKSRIDEKTNI